MDDRDIWTGDWMTVERSEGATASPPPALLDEHGFLKESSAGRDVRGLEGFEDDRCVALLGDAGMGKTHALESLRCLLLAGGRRVAVRRLGAYGEGRLPIDRLFTGPEFDEWRSGEGPLWLLLDALDESPYPPEFAADILLEGLRGLDLGRLYVRISMRPLVWSARVRDTLAQLFGAVRELQLLPLRRARVEARLPADGPSLSTLCERGLGPLLARPLTLQLLLDAGGASRAEASLRLAGIYDRALRHRYERAIPASEPVTVREERVERILRAADLLGAVTVLGGHEVFAVTSTLQGDALDVPRVFGAAAGGAIDALKGGPFAGDRSARTWEHLTFAEFHAARWVLARAGSAKEKARWLTGPTGSLDALPAPVQGVAVWMASVDGGFFDHLLAQAPAVLLGVDRASMGGDRRASLVRALLDGAANISLDPWVRFRTLRELAGDGVDALLASRIADPGASPAARDLALEIAEINGASEAVAAARKLALDGAQSLKMRVAAARVVAARGDDIDRLALRPLATGLPDDEADQLKGIALSALWRSEAHPRALISLDEVLACLSEPRWKNYFGAYRRVRGEFFQGLENDELPAVLTWAIGRIGNHGTDDYSREAELTDLMKRAWKDATDAAIALPLARLATEWTEQRHRFPLPPDSSGVHDRETRRTVLSALVTLCPTHDHLIWDLHVLIGADDLPWLMENAVARDTDPEGQVWARLAFDRFRAVVEAGEAGPTSRVQLIEDYWSLRERSAALRDESRWYFDEGVLLDSEAARMQREHRARRVDRQSNEPAQTNIQAAIERELVASDADPKGHFWQLVYWLHARPLPGDRVTFDSARFITETEMWKSADPPWRRTVVELAHRYILAGDPEPDVWYGKQLRHRPAYAGYLSLRLLAEFDPVAINTLPAEAWTRWMPVLIDALPDSNDPHHKRLMEQATNLAHDAFVTWVEREFEAEVDQHRDAPVLHRVPAEGDVVLADRLLPRLRAALPGPALGTLLRVIHTARPAEALDAAWAIVEGSDRERVEVAAAFLLERDGARAWPWLISRSKLDPGLGKAVVEAMGFGFSRDRTVFAALPVRTLAEIWEWAVSLWPYREWQGVRSIVSGDELRDKVLVAIEQAASDPRTTDEALNRLHVLAVQYQQFDWLPGVVQRAEHNVRLRRWHPHEIGALLAAP
ncbi:MAG: hypothetical protein KA978_11480 [Deltaproteobacteria bacterium]|nr:hypothetical protein [Deltaproteobacteria bacterium]